MQTEEEKIQAKAQAKVLAKIRKRFHKACADYGLIEDGDHILVAISGGKDSLMLTELLGERARIYVPRFKVTGVHVRMREIDYESDTQYLEDFCRAHGVELVVKTASINGDAAELLNGDASLNGAAKGLNGGMKGKNHCFLCSWYRRKMLFDVAQELGCNKIALGHHKDDIVETLLMNLVSQGAFATMPPKLQMEKMPLQLIRPLCLNEEADIQRYAELAGYEKQKKQCPFEHESSRSGMKKIVAQLKEMNPNAMDSIWGAMSNIKADYLPGVV